MRQSFDPTIFDRVRDRRFTGIRSFDVDLTNSRVFAAGSYVDYAVAGDSIYINADPADGNAEIVVTPQGDNVDDVHLYASPGAIFNIPFVRLRVFNTAQSVKKIRVVYGTNVDFQPGSVAQIAVTNQGGYTSERGEVPSGSYSSIALLAANTPETIFTPAANVNGAVVLSGGMTSSNGANITTCGFIAKSGAAPTNIGDGTVIFMPCDMVTVSTGYHRAGSMKNKAYIPAGMGLYALTTLAESSAQRYAQYKFL